MGLLLKFVEEAMGRAELCCACSCRSVEQRLSNFSLFVPSLCFKKAHCLVVLLIKGISLVGSVQ